jgi:Rrf2 family transcriptional regulator, iron-sulfur cluster assembly transcription factor
MLQISRRTDYAIRLMLEVASSGKVSTAEAARRQDISYPFARKVASQLASKGLLTGSRGNGGGLMLARPASEISVLDILNSIEETNLNACIDPAICPRRGICAVYPVWLHAQRALEGVLSSHSLASLTAPLGQAK